MSISLWVRDLSGIREIKTIPENTEVVLVDLSGQAQLSNYGNGTFDDLNPVRLLGVDISGNIIEYNQTAPPDPVEPAFYKAAGSVDQTGTPEQIAGATVTRSGVGQYDITFNTAANSNTYPVLATMQGLPQNDDYQWAYLNRTVNGFRIEVREQDNGGTAGVLRDSGFSFFVPII